MIKEIRGEPPARNTKLFGPITKVVVFFFVFGFYLFTLTPTVDFIDSGEFAAVCSTLGIAHPSGYPLFTLLGYAFSFLPIAPTTILRLNIMNALFAAVGILFFMVFLKQLLGYCFQGQPAVDDNQEETASPEPKDGKKVVAAPGPGVGKKTGKGKKSKRKKTKYKKEAASSAHKSITGHKKKKTIYSPMEIPDNTQWLLAAAAGLVLAFSFIYWDAATSLEVYSLHALFVSLLLFLLLKFVKAEDKKSETVPGFFPRATTVKDCGIFLSGPFPGWVLSLFSLLSPAS